MSCHSIRVDTDALERNPTVAVVRCLAEPLCVADLVTAIAAAQPTATRVVLAPHDATTAELARVVSPSGVVVTARPVTEALKRVEAGRVAATVDRDQFFRAGLPAGMPQQELALRLAETASRYVRVGELLGDGDVRFVSVEDESS